jgi:hypothetical protein
MLIPFSWQIILGRDVCNSFCESAQFIGAVKDGANWYPDNVAIADAQVPVVAVLSYLFFGDVLTVRIFALSLPCAHPTVHEPGARSPIHLPLCLIILTEETRRNVCLDTPQPAQVTSALFIAAGLVALAWCEYHKSNARDKPALLSSRDFSAYTPLTYVVPQSQGLSFTTQYM